MSETNSVFPKLIFDIHKFKRMWKGHVIINFESQILALFDNSIYKIQYFSLSMLAKNLSNFVSLPLKLNNPQCHTVQGRRNWGCQGWARGPFASHPIFGRYKSFISPSSELLLLLGTAGPPRIFEPSAGPAVCMLALFAWFS